MPVKRGHVVHQNSFLECIIRKFDDMKRNFVVANAHADFSIIYCNDGFCRLTGYSRAEVMRQPCSLDFLHGTMTSKETISQVKEAFSGSDETQVEMLVYRKDGSKFLCNLVIVPVKNESGETYVFIMNLEDVTEQDYSPPCIQQRFPRLTRARQSFRRSFRVPSLRRGSILSLNGFNTGKPMTDVPFSRTLSESRQMEKIDSAEELEGDDTEVNKSKQKDEEVEEGSIFPAIHKTKESFSLDVSAMNGFSLPTPSMPSPIPESDESLPASPPPGWTNGSSQLSARERRRSSMQRGSISLDDTILLLSSRNQQKNEKCFNPIKEVQEKNSSQSSVYRGSSSVIVDVGTSLNSMKSSSTISSDIRKGFQFRGKKLEEGKLNMEPKTEYSCLYPRLSPSSGGRKSIVSAFLNVASQAATHSASSISSSYMRATSSLDALSKHRISDIPQHHLWSAKSLNTSNGKGDKLAPNACSDSDLSRYRTLAGDRRKSPSLSVATERYKMSLADNTSASAKLFQAPLPAQNKMGEKVAQVTSNLFSLVSSFVTLPLGCLLLYLMASMHVGSNFP
ncbi:uncharacterized protein LOC136043045 [Artemia franciscana]|uniref:uncharacterized protein LOC136043045 n=1 Tax=Artemia franciscana TaxID=6661 RepID=UPI0032DAD60B